jgi:hypothetical protein
VKRKYRLIGCAMKPLPGKHSTEEKRARGEREDLYSNMDVRTRCGTRKVAKRTTVKTTHIVVELHCI